MRSNLRVVGALAAACFAITSTVALSAQTPPATAGDPYQEGQVALKAKHYGVAADAFARASAADTLRRVPLHPDAGLREAQARFELGQYAQADAVLQAFLKRDPNSAEALFLLGFVQQRENLPRESLATYNAAAKLATPTAEDLRRVSLDYVLLDDYPDALRWLERATATDPGNAEAWYDLARVQMHQGTFQKAEDSLRRSLAIRQGDPRALGNLGKCLENQNRTDEAIQSYIAAVAAAKASSRRVEEPYLDYGALLNTRSRFAEALSLLRRATELAPADAHAFEELGRAQVGLADLPAARTSFEQAVQLDPKNSRLHYQLARVYRSLGEREKAQQEFSRSSVLYGTTAKE